MERKVTEWDVLDHPGYWAREINRLRRELDTALKSAYEADQRHQDTFKRGDPGHPDNDMGM